jgi:hypothetical protein
VAAEILPEKSEMIGAIEKSNYRQINDVVGDITASDFMQKNVRISVEDILSKAAESEGDTFGQ